MMIGPNSSGRIAASIMTAQPAWQLPITQGLPSASGCSAITFSRKIASARADIFYGLVLHRLGEEADEIAGMARLHGHADFAIRLETADAWAVPCARIDDHERPGGRADFHVRRAE